MNSIEYGFHSLYLRYASDEVFQTAAIERISIRDKEAREKLEKLAREIARVESEYTSLVSLLSLIHQIRRS